MNSDLVIVAKGEMVLLGMTGRRTEIEICYETQLNIEKQR
jgi:hypothetical protein